MDAQTKRLLLQLAGLLGRIADELDELPDVNGLVLSREANEIYTEISDLEVD